MSTTGHDGKKTKVELLARLIALHVVGEEVLVRMEDEHAARVSTAEAAAFVAPHVLTVDIQMANVAFTQLFFGGDVA
jgi:hypothetical protein